ncbi:hypothetical protein [Symmachiella dynata]|uniref:hypothetical protein n=1 Tax=Symmachiella dynata TaxID=2527995 RepID=UPI0030EF6DF7
MARDKHHVRLRELPRGRRRRCVLLASGMAWFAFSLFLLDIAFWIWLKPNAPDAAAITTFVLIGVSMGISRGTHARLTLKDRESGEFVSQPSVFDFSLLALSLMMVIVGGCVAIANY